MSRIVFIASIIWIPGLLAYWGGRRLIGNETDPVFTDRLWRYRKQVLNAGLLVAIAVMLIAGGHALWLLPLMLLATLRGAYPLRRAVYGERWSFAAYASFTLRLRLGLGAFWISLVAVPWLGKLGKDHGLWIALAAAILIATRACARPLSSRLLELEPWRPAESEITEALDRMHAAATVPPPKVFRLPARGANWVNALAMPAVTEPWIIFSETLLKTFEPREVAAIYAHELAHLEEMNSSWAKRRELLEWGLVALAIAVTAYGAWSPGILPVHLAWALALLFGLARFQAASPGREERADLRALELLADPEAMESALLKLHAWSRMPRRWSWEEAKRLTHPTLARRLQCIRSAGAESTGAESTGAESTGDGNKPSRETPAFDRLLVAGNTSDSFLLLDRDHVRRLSGVPDGTDREPRHVLEAAAVVTSDRYDKLTELRLEPWSKSYRIAGRPLHGRKWTFVPWSAAWPRTLTIASGEALQRHLDRIDHLLVPPPDSGGALLSNTSIRILAGVAVLLALIPDFHYSVALVALAAALLPASAALDRTRKQEKVHEERHFFEPGDA